MVPERPSDLTAKEVSTEEIEIEWTDNSIDEVGFYVERKRNDQPDFLQVATLTSNATSYLDINLAPGTSYMYRVLAFNEVGPSESSNIIQVSTLERSITEDLEAPSELVAVALSDSTIRLSWNDNSSNETGFEIEFSTTGTSGPFTQITVTNAEVISFTHTGLTSDQEYTYRLRAVNSDGASGYSNFASATTTSSPQPPAAPTQLVVASETANAIALAWQDNSANENGFRIEGAINTSSPTFAIVGEVNADITSFEHTDLVSGESYIYRIVAYNEAGDSDYSNTATARTLSAPAAPSNLSAAAVSFTQVGLSWSDNAANEEGFQIERRLTRANFQVIATVAADITTFTDENLSEGTTYIYRISAFNAIGSSPFSNEASVQLPISEVTAFATEDNLLIFSSADPNQANQVFNSGLNECGCSFSVLPFNTEFVCGFAAVKFGDLQSAIAGRSIQRATLKLYVSYLPANPTVYTLNAFTANWNTNTITYNNAPGIYNANQVSFNSPVTSVVPVSIDITGIVSNWANGTWQNNGIVIQEPVAQLPLVSLVNISGFESLEANSGGDRRPQIVVEFN